ncbi:NAD(P)/FAD-dependent oxidoreductase [Quadrisphaera sp. KR29]|uniref:NAD(P)/FAD-dependent oxidoreductase n=1 Tax=Quadrisphaera sp. KR29 TaxID=3461391 RepID=UPI004044E104
MARSVIVVGAGITGTATADELAARGVRVTVLDRDGDHPRGSTAFAPGFVGLYNDAPVLTDLARASAAVYDVAGAGFERRGGLELATSDPGAREVQRRVGAAQEAGLPAHLLSPDALPLEVTSFVDTSTVVAAGHFPDDGVASPRVLTAALRARAGECGARFAAGEVAAIDVAGAVGAPDRVRVRTRAGLTLTASDVVLAAGVWGPHLAAMTGLGLPLFPVAHPYTRSAPRADLVPGPFVRWPEHHVYARVHGDRLGTGSYDHAPVSVEQADLVGGAGLAWRDDFDGVVDAAQRLLVPRARSAPAHRVNGVFAMTPDNLPFVGPHPQLEGVWVAQALWVTHAAGAARHVVAAVLDGAPLPRELAVDRFATGAASDEDLRRAALRLYRDIYANDSA